MPARSVSPVSSVAEALDRWRVGDRAQVLRSEFLDVLAAVSDPLDPRGRRYRLGALLAIAVLATAAGMRGYAGFATWTRTAPEDVLAQLGIRFRRPSEKTFRAVLARVDPDDLNRRLGAYFTAHATRCDPGRAAADRAGRQDPARRTARQGHRHPPGVGVRPPCPTGAGRARGRREKQRNPHRGRHAHTETSQVRFRDAPDSSPHPWSPRS